jgi:hypothetical protein
MQVLNEVIVLLALSRANGFIFFILPSHIIVFVLFLKKLVHFPKERETTGCHKTQIDHHQGRYYFFIVFYLLQACILDFLLMMPWPIAFITMFLILNSKQDIFGGADHHWSNENIYDLSDELKVFDHGVSFGSYDVTVFTGVNAVIATCLVYQHTDRVFLALWDKTCDQSGYIDNNSDNSDNNVYYTKVIQPLTPFFGIGPVSL